MDDMWITDMTHFLDAEGRPPSPAPPILRFLAAIVEASSGRDPGPPAPTGVPCRRRPGRQPCPGLIHAASEGMSGGINWYCPSCRDVGHISNWQNTPWDRRTRRTSMRPDEAATTPPGLSPSAARAWERVPPAMRVRLLNNVWCVTCQGMTSMAVTSGRVSGGDLVLHGTCTRCGGSVGRLIEGMADRFD